MSTETLTLTDFLLARIAGDEEVAGVVYSAAEEWPGNDAAVTAWIEDHDRRRILAERQPHSAACGWRVGEGLDEACSCGYPARVLAECEAKRRIVELRATTAYHVEQFAHAAVDDPFRIVYTTSLGTYDAVLRSLALPYADHADFREEWNPR